MNSSFSSKIDYGLWVFGFLSLIVSAGTTLYFIVLWLYALVGQGETPAWFSPITHLFCSVVIFFVSLMLFLKRTDMNKMLDEDTGE